LCNFDWNVGKTTPVGQYSPAGDGPYGNADLSGNVWEWTGSRGKPYKIEGGREDQAKYGEPQMRGGSFYDDQKTVRRAQRGCAVSVYDLMVHIGFRLAASVVSAT
jgi:formylglycine-generating enzyme required for sulfatase activity